jgi:hypothetical protein
VPKHATCGDVDEGGVKGLVGDPGADVVFAMSM